MLHFSSYCKSLKTLESFYNGLHHNEHCLHEVQAPILQRTPQKFPILNVFFSIQFKEEIYYKGALQNTRTNWEATEIIQWHTSCHFSYRKKVLYNHMRNPKDITEKVILLQKTKVS